VFAQLAEQLLSYAILKIATMQSLAETPSVGDR
jgi:hypothetical protein